ncbi:hypothetical protein C8F04DRAFT_1197304 [Mycena alexandri]|uniref:Uncharacterized protein n=1 Tax=Mycena alexandri TaxID=1745969 RepID=A0AAD6S4P2_9AGAR|nr:hypothetical protein C8F04DRAFT_1197304 [Mycena alexandri]
MFILGQIQQPLLETSEKAAAAFSLVSRSTHDFGGVRCPFDNHRSTWEGILDLPDDKQAVSTFVVDSESRDRVPGPLPYPPSSHLRPPYRLRYLVMPNSSGRTSLEYKRKKDLCYPVEEAKKVSEVSGGPARREEMEAKKMLNVVELQLRSTVLLVVVSRKSICAKLSLDDERVETERSRRLDGLPGLGACEHAVNEEKLSRIEFRRAKETWAERRRIGDDIHENSLVGPGMMRSVSSLGSCEHQMWYEEESTCNLQCKYY